MPKPGRPEHYFGDYYLGGGGGGTFILYHTTDPFAPTIYLKSKSYQQALKEAREYR